MILGNLITSKNYCMKFEEQKKMNPFYNIDEKKSHYLKPALDIAQMKKSNIFKQRTKYKLKL